MSLLSVIVFAMTLQFGITASAAEASVKDAVVSDNSIKNISVSDNSVSDNDLAGISVSDNSVPVDSENNEDNSGEDTGVVPGDTPITDNEPADNPSEPSDEPSDETSNEPQTEEAANTEDTAAEANAEAEVQHVDSNQLQSINYKDSILTDWQQITQALASLTPQALTDTAADSPVAMLQLQNVTNIPADVKNALVTTDGSGRTKLLHCNIGYGAALVFNGAADNSGFTGINNASTTVYHEKRGKRSMATIVKFTSHENLGTVVSLHVNLPQCAEGTKVSVYAETISVDADGNVTVGENVCIGNTKADANGNVEVPIQSTANYMFVYKAAKE